MGPLSQFFISTLIDNFCSDIYDKIKNNFLESSLFQDFSTSIKTDFSIDECNKLLKSVFKKIRRNPYFTNLSKNELQQLMNDNKELIYSWIICDTPFKTELLKLQDDNSNSIHTGFLKSLYHFINIEKDNYSAISSQRIIQTNNKIYSNTETIITKIENINRRLSSTFSPELSEIEELLSVRKIHDAQQKLDALEQKILKNNVNEEIEKFYQLKANSYLLNSETQMEAIPWLNKLVMYSKSSFLKEYRKGLISFISKNYDEAFRILSLLSNMDLTTEENKLYSNFKFNLLFTTHKWEKVDLLIKDTSQDSSIWSIKADFFKENYDQAFSKLNTIDEVNVDFDDKVLFINIKIYYYIDLISKENYSFKIIEKLNEFIPEIDKLLKLANDDTSTKKTLYLLKALVFQYSNQTELSINEYGIIPSRT